MFCGYRPIRRTDHSFRTVLQNVCLIVCDLQATTMKQPMHDMGLLGHRNETVLLGNPLLQRWCTTIVHITDWLSWLLPIIIGHSFARPFPRVPSNRPTHFRFLLSTFKQAKTLSFPTHYPQTGQHTFVSYRVPSNRPKHFHSLQSTFKLAKTLSFPTEYLQTG
jgi:hypothetical protein